jgi:hypothetical protein
VSSTVTGSKSARENLLSDVRAGINFPLFDISGAARCNDIGYSTRPVNPFPDDVLAATSAMPEVSVSRLSHRRSSAR